VRLKGRGTYVYGWERAKLPSLLLELVSASPSSVSASLVPGIEIPGRTGACWSLTGSPRHFGVFCGAGG
jgi:hypothetical protein